MAPAQESLRRKVWLPAQLHNPLRDLVGMRLFLNGVLHELRLHPRGPNACRRKVMASIAEHADNLGGQRLVEQLTDCLRLLLISQRHCAILDLLTCTLAERFDVRQKRRSVLLFFHMAPLW